MTTIGVVGARWRATVTPWGAIDPWDGSARLEWWIAADDRWHTPRQEASVRQRLVRGAPVAETSVRVPGGDALQRVYALADGGGLTVVEVENASSLPFAVAFSRHDLLTSRPPATIEPLGIQLPAGAVTFPVGHRATVRVALPHSGGGAGALPGALASADRVASGWVAQTGVAARVEVPEGDLVEQLVGARAALLLEGPGDPEQDPAAFLLAVAERTRLGEPAAPWVDDVAAVAARLANAAVRRAEAGWEVAAAMAATIEVMLSAGERRGAEDAAAIASSLPVAAPLPVAPPSGAARFASWSVRRLVVPTADGADIVPFLPAVWLGQDIAAHAVPVAGGTLSFAVRWHGMRPALLWETTAPMTLRSTGLDPWWSTTADRGEALLAGHGEVTTP